MQSRAWIGVRRRSGLDVAGLHVHIGSQLLDTQAARMTVEWLAAFAAEDVHGDFGAGPRFCPGRNLALLEARAALAMLARHFEIVLDPAAPPVRERFGFTMQPTGLRVLVRPR